jgi:hypothetical protein
MNLFTEPPVFHTGPRLISRIVVNFKYRDQDAKLHHDIVRRAFSDFEADYTERLKAANGGLATPRRIMYLYGRSFLIQLTALVFTLVYGICQVVTYRWFDNTPWLADGANRMNFGQIAPLILLLLPVLNGAEILYGIYTCTPVLISLIDTRKDEDDKNDSNTSEVS